MSPGSKFFGFATLGLALCLLGWKPACVEAAEGNSQARQATNSRKPRGQPFVLGTFKVGPQGDLTYELSIGTCVKEECPFQVRLREGNNVYATLRLDWSSSTKQAKKEHVAFFSGVGDPLEKDKPVTAWSSGYDESQVLTLARSISLAPNLNGLVVDQVGGFEHVKRAHYLFVALGRKLIRAWTGSEGAGPHRTFLQIISSASSHRQELLYFYGFRNPSEDQPDQLDVASYYWDTRTSKLGERAAGEEFPPLFAVVVGVYDTIPQARQTRSQGSECIGSFWVLKTDDFAGLDPGKALLGALTANKLLAEQTQKAAKTCNSGLEPQVIPWKRRSEKAN